MVASDFCPLSGLQALYMRAIITIVAVYFLHYNLASIFVLDTKEILTNK